MMASGPATPRVGSMQEKAGWVTVNYAMRGSVPEGDFMLINLPEVSTAFVRAGSWEVLSSPAEWDSDELRRAWERLLAGRPSVTSVYLTPGWFDHVASMAMGETILVAVTRDPSEQIAGIAPIHLTRRTLDVHARGRTLLRLPMRKAILVGGRPLGSEDPDALDRLFEAIATALPQADAIQLAGLETDSFLWHYLCSSEMLRDRFLVFVPEGVHPYRVLDLPETFADYLARFSAKKRYNLNRQIGILQRHGEGKLELQRIDSPSGTALFLEAQSRMESKGEGGWGATLGENDICHWSRFKVADLGSRGFLRSYVLMCGKNPVSMIKGLQHRSTYFALQTLYSKKYAAFSPGASILHLAIEDLLAERRVQRIEFGFGEPKQRHHAGSAVLEVASVLLMRKTLANRMRAGIHAAFFSAVRLAKKIRDQRNQRPQIAGFLGATITMLSRHGMDWSTWVEQCLAW